MQIIYTCPKCGHDLQELMLPSNPPQYEKHCPNCGWSHIEKQQNDVVRTPYSEKRDNVNYLGGTWVVTTDYTYIPPACKACPNHPNNGGSGICNCTLGSPQVIC